MSDRPAVPESTYATQLREGFPRLRFVRDLEAEFREEFAERHLSRLRAGTAVAAVLYLVFLLVRLKIEAGTFAQWGLVLRPMALGFLLLTLAASYLENQKLRRKVLTPLVVLSYLSFALAVTGIEVLEKRHGFHRHYESLILIFFHLYVFSGLLLRPALIVGGFMLLIYLIGGGAGGLATREWADQLMFLGLTQIIGAVALYSIEWLERDSFLRRRMFGTLATQDGLTGLFNRITFFNQCEGSLRFAARQHACIGVVLVDVDHFKAYNDRYGHLEGDQCLRAVAGAIRGEFRRPEDVVARYGGEEFVGLWYDIQPESLRSLADQVRGAVQALRIPHRDAPNGRVTASVGAVAVVPGLGQSLTELVQKADEALYEAKEKGRNRAVTVLLPSAHAPLTRGRRAPTLTG